MEQVTHPIRLPHLPHLAAATATPPSTEDSPCLVDLRIEEPTDDDDDSDQPSTYLQPSPDGILKRRKHHGRHYYLRAEEET